MSRVPILFAYWEGFTQSGPAPFTAPPLHATPSFVDVVAIAFAVPGDNSTIITDFIVSNNNTKADIIKDTQTLQSRGQKVVISINGNDKVPWGTLRPTVFAESIYKLSQEWKLDGIDLDNETWGPVPGQHFADVINAIRNKMGNDFIITYPAYQGAPRDDFLKVAHKDLTYVMTMAYWQDYASAVQMFQYYKQLIGGPEKLMIGIKPGKYGANQSTPEGDVPKIVAYKPNKGEKAGIMLYSLSLDYQRYTGKDRYHWTNWVNKTLKN